MAVDANNAVPCNTESFIKICDTKSADKALPNINIHPDTQLAVGSNHQFIQIVHIQNTVGKFFLAGTVKYDFVIGIPDFLCKLVLHHGHHLCISAQGSHQVADIRSIIGLKGIGYPIIGIQAGKTGFKTSVIFYKGRFLKNILRRYRILHCASNPISNRRISKASAYFFPIS